ncbi:hypothetical protein HOF56_02460 [Candidatus Peribacteria bacterium]|jgi:hypothetical protein|nr:hypothetical protein [Candidatus Peribacteria bacterium]MBT4021342.1 hypothetical protein [Candidatus Peribacteria bacterium]MBT4241197.1 hypothetical protein [Candidatus Peribacteria bacterium]MBT4474222.1 hypothetical protein [Candidatus Peribacteria bacterium]
MASASQYSDDDLVYVDPDKKEILGKVEFDANGKPKKLPYPSKEEGRAPWRKFFPWGTHKSMENAWLKKRGGSEDDSESSFDDALERLLKDKI